MTVATTSIQAYNQMKDSGNLGKQKRLVLAVIRPGLQYTRSELAAFTGLPINCICGRVRELLDEERLVEANRPRVCSVTGHTAKTVRLPEPDGA